MPFQRDPLSVRFDGQAAAVIRLAIEQATRHAGNARLVPYVRVRGPATPGDIGRESGGYQLTKTERAFQRSLYHDSRVHRIEDAQHRKPSGVWSLKVTWADVPLLPGASRVVTVQVFPASSGSRHAASRAKTANYVENPDLQSGYDKQVPRYPRRAG